MATKPPSCEHLKYCTAHDGLVTVRAHAAWLMDAMEKGHAGEIAAAKMALDAALAATKETA